MPLFIHNLLPYVNYTLFLCANGEWNLLNLDILEFYDTFNSSQNNHILTIDAIANVGLYYYEYFLLPPLLLRSRPLFCLSYLLLPTLPHSTPPPLLSASHHLSFYLSMYLPHSLSCYISISIFSPLSSPLLLSSSHLLCLLLSTPPFLFLLIYLYIYLSIYLFIYVTIHLLIYVFNYQSTHLFLSPFLFLSITCLCTTLIFIRTVLFE